MAESNQDNLKDDSASNTFSTDKNYWDKRWKAGATGWDIGYASPAIIQYMQQYPDKKAAILIPGCGNAYEAAELVKMGFENITLLDISHTAVNSLKEKFSGISQIKVLCEDFFTHRGRYNLMIEQTFFCALPPSMRKKYAMKACELLIPNGKIIGLLYNKKFDKEGPPFGGSVLEYQPLFDPYFEIKTMEPCTNSIQPRASTEVFIILKMR